MKTGIIIVDHGSRRPESNTMLERVAELFAGRFASTAYAACVRRGATNVIVAPFFLGPGKHWNNDIPRLTAEAAADFPGTRYHVTQTLGIDDLILDLLHKRVSHCTGSGLVCDVCRGTVRSGEPGLTVAAAGSNGHAAAHAPAADGQPAVCSSCPYQSAINAGATLVQPAGGNVAL
jgi:sirohydrochlorin ferrochelatase